MYVHFTVWLEQQVILNMPLRIRRQKQSYPNELNSKNEHCAVSSNALGMWQKNKLNNKTNDVGFDFIKETSSLMGKKKGFCWGKILKQKYLYI